MIRKTLPRTKEATWCVFIPSPTPGAHGAPVPIGTCFFVDPSGYLLTANHVVVDEAGNPRDILWLQRPPTPPDWGTAMIQGVEIVARWPDVDVALLKADFGANATKAWAEGRTDFPYVPLSFDIPEDGTPVYGYGFAIQPTTQVVDLGGAIMALGGLRPRTTSAIVASNVEQIGPVQASGDPSFIVIDKAWNYGNSGGPLILQETGEAVGVAVRFQPVRIEQSPGVYVVVPSLYGAASAVRNIADSLRASVPIFAR